MQSTMKRRTLVELLTFENDGVRDSECILMINGCVGSLNAALGKNFFHSIKEHIPEISKIVKYLDCHILTEHIPIYRRMGLDVIIDHECIVDGYNVTYVRIKQKE